MLLKRLQSPRTAVPIGMALICTGLLLNSMSQILLRHWHASPGSGIDTLDFARGFCIGLGIVLEIAGIFAMIPAVRARKRRESPLPPQG